jgi:hypothetical protein
MDLLSASEAKAQEIGSINEIKLQPRIARRAGGSDFSTHELPHLGSKPLQAVFHGSHNQNDHEHQQKKLDDSLA